MKPYTLPTRCCDSSLQICCNCKYFCRTVVARGNAPQKFGTCHRYPPIIFVGIGGGYITKYPDVIEFDFCGEFIRNEIQGVTSG